MKCAHEVMLKEDQRMRELRQKEAETKALAEKQAACTQAWLAA